MQPGLPSDEIEPTWASSIRQTLTRTGIASIVIIAAVAPGHAATIAVAGTSGNSAVVTIEGDFTLQDGEQFAKIVAPFAKATIVLDSPGGNLLAGLRIGEIAQTRGFATIVPDGAQCASACAVAWLGGAHRYLGSHARVGFHAAFFTKDGTDNVSSSGNALLGAYFDRLGLSYEAIYALTDSGPSDALWLDVNAANDLGIATEAFPVDGAAPAAAAPPSSNSVRSRAIEQVQAYFAAGSSDAGSAVAWLGRNYDLRINYYGKSTTRDAVMKEKRAFVTRWPERLYIPDSPIDVECSSDGATCHATGTVAFECRSYMRGAYSAGSAAYDLTFDMRRAEPMIVAESSRVVTRR